MAFTVTINLDWERNTKVINNVESMCIDSDEGFVTFYRLDGSWASFKIDIVEWIDSEKENTT